MAHNPLRIELHQLPGSGKDLEGTLPASVFALELNDPVKATSPLTFQLHVEKDDDELLLTGALKACFELECGRCLEKFAYSVDLEDYASEMEITEGTSTMDLTDVVRDDILVALPSYPRCEDGNVEPRECPAQGRFEATAEQVPGDSDTAAGEDAGVWKALDQLKN